MRRSCAGQMPTGFEPEASDANSSNPVIDITPLFAHRASLRGLCQPETRPQTAPGRSHGARIKPSNRAQRKPAADLPHGDGSTINNPLLVFHLIFRLLLGLGRVGVGSDGVWLGCGRSFAVLHGFSRSGGVLLGGRSFGVRSVVVLRPAVG